MMTSAAENTSENAMSDLSDLQCRTTATTMLSVVNIVLGVVCFGFGIPTVVLTSSNSAYPFSSGSGIYTGILVIVAGALGIVLFHKAKTVEPDALKGFIIAYRVFISIGIDVGAVHFAFGIWTVVVCSRGVTQATCGGINWSANYLLAVCNMVIGFTIFVVCAVTYFLSWKPIKRLWQRTKVRGTVPEVELEAK